MCDHQPSSYNCDIWSLGMTAIEIADKKLPYDDWTNPFRIIRAVSTNPPPTLNPDGGWSQDFHNFIARCLVKDPTKRPNAAELLDDPFLNRTKTRKTKAVLKPVLDQFFANQAAEREAKKKRELMGGTIQPDEKEYSLTDCWIMLVMWCWLYLIPFRCVVLCCVVPGCFCLIV